VARIEGIISSCATRPDAQAFDEIRIVTTPRYKTSGLSGDEWRISAMVQFFRKGKVIHSVRRRNIETAAGFLYADMLTAIDDGHAYFAGDGEHCDQEGCGEKAVVRYKIKKKFCRDGRVHEQFGTQYRHFCDQHKKRGDCGLDADDNYEEIPIWLDQKAQDIGEHT